RGVHEEAAPAPLGTVNKQLVVGAHDEFEVEENLFDSSQSRLHFRRRVLDDLQRALQTLERGLQIDKALAGRGRFEFAAAQFADEHVIAQNKPPLALEGPD